jgi:DNA polymerase-3 subunit gamma/tau
MLKLVRHVVRSGYDLQEVLVGLAEHLRNLLVARSLGADALEEVAQSTRTRYAEEGDRFDEADLLRLLTMAGDAEDEVKQSPQPRLRLETTLLKMAQLRRSADLRDVLAKIDRLEQMAEEGELPEAVPGDGATGTEPSASEAEETGSAEDESQNDRSEAAAEPIPDYGPESDTQSDPSEMSSPSGDESSGPSSSSPDETASPASTAPEASEEENETEAPDEDPPDSAPDPSVEYNDLFGAPALQSDESSENTGGADATGDRTSGGDSGAAKDGTAQAATVAEPAVATASSDDNLTAVWPRVVQAVKEEHISLGSLLGEADPVECTDGTLTVAVPRDLHRDTLRDRRRVLLQHITATTERTIEEVRFVVETTTDDPAADANAADEPLSPREQLQQLRDMYPALNVLFADFGAEPVW